MIMSENILRLEHANAKEFFLTQEAFTNIELPCYFSFDDVLKKIDESFKNKVLNLSELHQAKKHETINHLLYGNKDGKYAWRKYQIIHPLVYISLVNIITQKDNWVHLQNRFKNFQQANNITCESLPMVPRGKNKQKATQISRWISHVEKKSISLALEYKFLYHTDITDCYGSIYTHSLVWAIHTKEEAKNKRQYDELFGNKVDHHLQAMTNGQTNGIPQGSILMDFIAEIVLGYADLELKETLEKTLDNKEYCILRYRDDYRIFVNDISVGDNILKSLNETLINLGFHLNANKTFYSQDVISGALKEDKMSSLKYGLVPQKLTKTELLRQLLIVQRIGSKFPNSGTLINRLSKICDFSKPEYYKSQEEVLTAILMDIGYNNPKTFPLVAGLMSSYIFKLEKPAQGKLLKKIQKNFLIFPILACAKFGFRELRLA